MEIYIVTFVSREGEFYTDTRAYRNKADAQAFFDTNVEDICSDYGLERSKYCEGNKFTIDDGNVSFYMVLEQLPLQ